VKGDVIEYGERPCKSCGQPHERRALGDSWKDGASWASPWDGHDYQPKSWETMYRELLLTVGSDG